jgi:hypothetical protein
MVFNDCFCIESKKFQYFYQISMCLYKHREKKKGLEKKKWVGRKKIKKNFFLYTSHIYIGIYFNPNSSFFLKKCTLPHTAGPLIINKYDKKKWSHFNKKKQNFFSLSTFSHVSHFNHLLFHYFFRYTSNWSTFSVGSPRKASYHTCGVPNCHSSIASTSLTLVNVEEA